MVGQPSAAFRPGEKGLRIGRVALSQSAAQCQFLTQVQNWGQLRDGFLPPPHLRGRGRLQQPAGKGDAAHWRGSRVQQVQQRSPPKEVQIGGERMTGRRTDRVAERQRIPIPGDPAQSLGVEVGEDRGATAAAPKITVVPDEEEKGSEQEHSGGGSDRRSLPDAVSERACRGEEREQAEVGNPVPAPRQGVSFPREPIVASPVVVLRHGHGFARAYTVPDGLPEQGGHGASRQGLWRHHEGGATRSPSSRLGGA